MTDNETVTISTEYFLKLHRLANEIETMQRMKTDERMNEEEGGKK